MVTIGTIVGRDDLVLGSAKKTFKGPIRTIDELDVESALPDDRRGAIGAAAMIALGGAAAAATDGRAER